MIKLASQVVFAAAITLGLSLAVAQTSASSCCAPKTTPPLCCTSATQHAPDGQATGATEADHPHGGSPAGASCCSTAEKTAEDGGGHRGGKGRGAVMPDAMHLLHNHAALERSTEDIPNGVKTRTTTKDPAVLELLRRHPRDMHAFYEAGGSVRPRDPLFAELSRVAGKVKMEFKDIENGIEAVATSEDAEVVKLLRAHAVKVSEFVKRGMSALHEGAPLPNDYQATK